MQWTTEPPRADEAGDCFGPNDGPRNDRIKRAYLVLGPECSGTRLMASILMMGGCVGSSDHYQWWDEHEFEEEDTLVVWRRSFPHGEGRAWPDVSGMVGRLEASGYGVQAVVMVREQFSLARSQVFRGYAATELEARGRINTAFCRIFEGLGAKAIPFVVVTYEGLVARPERVQFWLAEALGLPAVPHVRITDENEKHYGVPDDGRERGVVIARGRRGEESPIQAGVLDGYA